jgi:glycosyltransferase involved in cell wall biosynthesis
MDLNLPSNNSSTVTILIPCLNEDKTIRRVVSSFKMQMPKASILVIDNGSLDNTVHEANSAGALVVVESRRGKGNAIETGLRMCSTDYVIMVDGDSTYDHMDANVILRELSNGYDMVVANRVSVSENAYRKGHLIGNRLLSTVQQKILGVEVVDTLSGYRGFRRNFVQNYVASSSGFEVEANLNIFASIVGAKVGNIDSNYGARHKESSSKLNTLGDGLRILLTVTKLMFNWRPLLMYSLIGSALLGISLTFLSIPVGEYLKTGQVLHIPTLIVSTFTLFFAAIMFFLGLIANQIVNFRIENARRDFKLFRS